MVLTRSCFVLLFFVSAFHFSLQAQTTEEKPKEITFVMSGNENFSMKVFGFAQFRLEMTDPEQGSAEHEYSIPLARIGFSGNAFEPNLTYKLNLQANTRGNSNNVGLIDGWLSYQWNEYFALTVGRILLPYSRQFYTHPGEVAMTDISEADFAFNLPRALGAQLSGTFGKLNYHLVSMNSVRALDAAGEDNNNNHLGGLLRLEYNILEPYGYIESMPTGVTAPQLSLGVAGAINSIVADSIAQNVAAGDETENLTVDLGFRLNRMSLQAARYARKTHGRGLKNTFDDGSVSQIGFFAMPEKLEVVGRYSLVNFGDIRTTGSIEGIQESAVGINYYIKGHNIKLQSDFAWLNYDTLFGDTEDRRFRLQSQFLF